MATILSNGLVQFSDGRILYSDTVIHGQDFMELQALLPQLNPVIGRSAMVGFPFVSGGGGGAGSPGPRGADGAPGITGPDGVQGATGIPGGGTGAQGVTGIQGMTGPTGGPPGATGVQGQTGVQGGTGVQGPQGSTGIAGSQGQTGVQGTQGQTGVQGNTGAGTVGATGPQGVTGPGSGAQGVTGVQGATGPTGGPQGATGVQGGTGVQGQTGAGSQGTTGTQGATGVVSANAWIQGGNSFGATGVLGTIDAQDVNIIRGGTIQAVVTSGAINPAADNNGVTIGTAARRWTLVRAVTVTTGDLNLQSEDGLSNWTLKEEPDAVALINRNTGRRYYIVLDEIDPDPSKKDPPPGFFKRLFGKS